LSKSSAIHILAFDFGTKRIGVAVSSIAAAKIANACTELKPIRATEGVPDWNELASILEDWKPAKIIVGLPIDSDGSEMEITRRARKFGNRINGRFGYEVDFFDETLSTKAAKAEPRLRKQSRPHAKAPVDSIAARLILESWLAENQND